MINQKINEHLPFVLYVFVSKEGNDFSASAAESLTELQAEISFEARTFPGSVALHSSSRSPYNLM